MVRVFSIVYLAFLLVVRLADEDQVCPSLAVEMEKCENEKQRAISAEKANHSASVNAMQAEAGEVRKKLENERDQCLKSLEKSKSGLVECTTESESWKKTMEGKMKAKKTEHEASLTKLQKQISEQKEKLEQMEKKEKATLAKLKKKHAEKEQELNNKLVDKEQELKKKLDDKDQELKKSKAAAAKKLASEKEKLRKALEDIKSNETAMDRFKKKKADELASLKTSHKGELQSLLKQKTEVESLLAEKEKRLVTQSKELEEKSREITKTKEKVKDLRHRNTESLKAIKELTHLNEENEAKNIQLEKELAKIMRSHEELATKKDEQAKFLEDLEDEFVSIRARHVEETAKLKKKAEAEKRKIEKKINKIQGDVLFGGSWIQVPQGWNGVLSLDLRLFRSIGYQLWSRVVGDRKIVGSIPKEYREFFSNGMKLLNEVPSLDDLHQRYMIIFAVAKDFSTALVQEYSPLMKETGETIARSWEKASIVGGEFRQKNIQPHLDDISRRVNKLYGENEIGPLYVDPARQTVMDIAQPIYKDTIHPLYQEYVLSTVENIPQYRSQMKTFAVRLEKDLRGGWRMTKNWGREAQSQFKTRSALIQRSSALWWSTISVKGQVLFKRVSAPLKLFGGKVKFNGGVLEAAAVGTVVLLVAWSSASYLGFIFGVSWFIAASAYTISRFLLVTVLLKLVIYTIAWRLLILGSIMSLFYLLSFVLRIVGLAIKVVFFPIKVALKLVKCVLKCMCCCGLCCRGMSKSGKSTPNGSQTKGMNGKLKKVSSPSTNDSSTSSDEGKKKGKKRNKKAKQGSKGNSTKSEKKKKRKRGGK